MTPINNSDTAWLVVSDYNQDNNLSYEELRGDILDPDINGWNWDDYKGFRSSIIGHNVGTANEASRQVGMSSVDSINASNGVGAGVGGIGYGNLVGGHSSDWIK